MIPRLKPALGFAELFQLLQLGGNDVEAFEHAFAALLGNRYAIAYPYGRSALWAFLKAMGIDEQEVIMPAYTCSVVAHAVVLSNNTPVFIDASLEDYNMCIDHIAENITEKTRAILVTHLFGYPMDVVKIQSIVEEAEQRYGHKIWIIQDCAHSFGAEWDSNGVHTQRDVALFGLNISKTITSIFGGMLTTDDDVLAKNLSAWRNVNFASQSLLSTIKKRVYLAAVYPAFHELFYGFVYWLQENTTTLSGLTDAYHLDEKIHLPPDFQNAMLPLEARVGIAQTQKYHGIIKHRQEAAAFYDEQLRPYKDKIGVLPPIREGATYSHYVIRVEDRKAWMKAFAAKGIQLGQLIEYSMPEMTAYQAYVTRDYPNARSIMTRTINVPLHTSVDRDSQQKIVEEIINYVV